MTRPDRGAIEEAARSLGDAAVAGLDALPQALRAVADGAVSGKIIVYPQRPGLRLSPVRGWNMTDEQGLTGWQEREENP